MYFRYCAQLNRAKCLFSVQIIYKLILPPFHRKANARTDFPNSFAFYTIKISPTSETFFKILDIRLIYSADDRNRTCTSGTPEPKSNMISFKNLACPLSANNVYFSMFLDFFNLAILKKSLFLTH